MMLSIYSEVTCCTVYEQGSTIIQFVQKATMICHRIRRQTFLMHLKWRRIGTKQRRYMRTLLYLNVQVTSKIMSLYGEEQ